MRFKVGDMVIGNHKARDYTVTKPGVIVELIKIDGDAIFVKTKSGFEYWVDEDKFDLYETDNSEIGLIKQIGYANEYKQSNDDF